MTGRDRSGRERGYGEGEDNQRTLTWPAANALSYTAGRVWAVVHEPSGVVETVQQRAKVGRLQ